MAISSRHLCHDGVSAGPDLAARRLIMAALLYYQFSTNIMNDRQYDDLGLFVRDNFADVSPVIRFCLGENWADDDGITGWTSSGFQFKVTRRLYNAAQAWAEHVGLDMGKFPDWEMEDYDMENDVEFSLIRS